MYLKNPNALFFKWNYFFYLDRILETACVRKLGYNVKKLIREIFHIFSKSYALLKKMFKRSIFDISSDHFNYVMKNIRKQDFLHYFI